MAPSRATLRSLTHISRASRCLSHSSARHQMHHQVGRTCAIERPQVTRGATLSSSRACICRSQSQGYATAAVESPSDPAAVQPPDFLDEKEKSIFLQLREELQPTALEVQDVSGGCGSMYAVAVTSERFKGMTMIKQHRLVNDILKDKIKDWHGLQLRTQAP